MAITNFASEVFGKGGGDFLIPRQKFNFTLIIQTDNSNTIFHRVSSVTAPSFNVEGQIMNQYNKKRFVQTRLNYDPVTVTFYDTFDDQFHFLMRDYIAHYYNGGEGLEQRTPLEGSSTVTPNFITDLGFTPNSNRYFFPVIKIIQNGMGGYFRETRLINPAITSIQGDTLDYSDSNPVMYTVTFQPESIQYLDVGRQFNDGI